MNPYTCSGLPSCHCRGCVPYARMDEVAKFLRITKKDGTPDRNEAARFVRQRRVRTYKRGGKTLLVKWADLEAALVEQTR